jgi:hypothetical protein
VGLEQGIPCRHESLVRAEYVPALCTHRPSLLPIGWPGEQSGLPSRRKILQTLSFRGRRSRNKASVGEPAEGSLLSKNLLERITLIF